jgi:hypothetical protein
MMGTQACHDSDSESDSEFKLRLSCQWAAQKHNPPSPYLEAPKAFVRVFKSTRTVNDKAASESESSLSQWSAAVSSSAASGITVVQRHCQCLRLAYPRAKCTAISVETLNHALKLIHRIDLTIQFPRRPGFSNQSSCWFSTVYLVVTRPSPGAVMMAPARA